MRLESFRASNGCVDRFVKRFALCSAALHGQAGILAATDIVNRIGSFPEFLHPYTPDILYNVDATGLLKKLLPRRTYVTTFENKKNVSGEKAMSAKDPVTAYIFTSCDGNFRLLMAMIGTSKQQRCFWLEKPLVLYIY